MARIFGLLFSGAVVRLAAAAFAIYLAYHVGVYVVGVFDQVHSVLGAAHG